MLALAVGAIACESEPAPCVLDAADRAALETIEREFVTAARTGNLEATIPRYAPDVEMMPPNAPAIRGRDAVRAAVADLPPVTKYDVTIESVVGCGDVAVVNGGYALTVQLSDSAAPFEDTGRYLHVFRKIDGEWLVTYDIFSSDRPAP